jgi:Uncharacterized protein conserved in bacteria (DUF2188)
MQKPHVGAQRLVLHVLFHENGWLIKEEGKTIDQGPYPAKEDAVEQAKVRARSARLGQVLVHKKDHTIETEYTYGDGSRDILG